MESHAVAAVRFAESVILTASDWEEVQQALADHPRFGPWLEGRGDPAASAQSVIRIAEQNLGHRVPY